MKGGMTINIMLPCGHGKHPVRLRVQATEEGLQWTLVESPCQALGGLARLAPCVEFLERAKKDARAAAQLRYYLTRALRGRRRGQGIALALLREEIRAGPYAGKGPNPLMRPRPSVFTLYCGPFPRPPYGQKTRRILRLLLDWLREHAGVRTIRQVGRLLEENRDHLRPLLQSDLLSEEHLRRLPPARQRAWRRVIELSKVADDFKFLPFNRDLKPFEWDLRQVRRYRRRLARVKSWFLLLKRMQDDFWRKHNP